MLLGLAGAGTRGGCEGVHPYTKFTEKFFSDSEFQGRLTREARSAAYRMIRRRHGLSEGGR